MKQIEKLSTLNEIFTIKDRMSVIKGKCTISNTQNIIRTPSTRRHILEMLQVDIFQWE